MPAPSNPKIDEIVSLWCPPGVEAGYIFAVATHNIEEIIGRGILAVKRQFADSVQFITKGTPALCLDMSAGTVFGLFVARGPFGMNLVPDAFVGNRRGMPTPYPVQVPAECAIQTPPIGDRELASRVGVPKVKIGRVAAQDMASMARHLLATMPPPAWDAALEALKSMQGR
jgi:hypothetical protein